MIPMSEIEKDGQVYEITDAAARKDIEIIISREVNVLDFGATGDGATNDTDALQAAIDYAFASGRMRVYLPAGTYVISAPLLLTTSTDKETIGRRWWDGHGVQLVGDSRSTTIIKKVGTATWQEDSAVVHETEKERAYMQDDPIDAVLILSGLGTGVIIRDIYVHNTSTAAPSYGIYGSRSGSVVERVNIHTNSRGINMYSFYNKLSDIRYICAEKALTIGQGTSSIIEKMFVSSCNNPYDIDASYTNVNNLCGDGCTGDMFTLFGTGLVLNACGCESPACRYLINIKSDSSVTVNGFYGWRQDGSGDTTLSASAVVRFSGKASLSINDICLLERSQLAENHYLVSCVNGVTIDLRMRGFRTYPKTGVDNAPYTKVFAARPAENSHVYLEADGLEGYYYVDSNLDLIPSHAFRADHAFVADNPQPLDSATVPAHLLYKGLGAYDFDHARPAWYNGANWIGAAMLPVTPTMTSFIDTENGYDKVTETFANKMDMSADGYKTGYRFNSSGVETANDEYWISNYIAATVGQVVRVRYASAEQAPPMDNGMYAQPVLVRYTSASSSAVSGASLYGSEAYITIDDDQLGFAYTVQGSGTQYVRISGRGTADGIAVAVDEEIGYKTETIADSITLSDTITVQPDSIRAALVTLGVL